MKKVTIKTVSKYFLYTLLALVLLVGCSEFYPNSEKFVIRKMESYDSIYNYTLMPTKGKGLLHIRSKHFYKVGDTLTLKPN